MFMDKDSAMVTARGKEGQSLSGQAAAASENSQVFKASYTGGVLTSKPMSVWLDGYVYIVCIATVCYHPHSNHTHTPRTQHNTTHTRLSASASEVLAGALHDNCRAVTVGSTR